MFNSFEILNSVSESMAVINSDGDILFTNNAWRSFPNENKGALSCIEGSSNYFKVCDSTEGDEKAMADSAKLGIQKVINNALKIFEMEYPCNSPTEQLWFILRANKILTHPELTLLSHIDITNRKLAELQIEKNYDQSLIINERIHTTLHKIVHDIQNPLSGIIGLVGLSKSETDVTMLNEYLDLIEEGSNELSVFVKDTLQHLSTSENSQSLQADRIIASYLNSIKQLLKSHAIKLTHTIIQEAEFHADEIEFRSIVSNLVNNSIKYRDVNKRDKFIKIHFSSDEKSAVFKVEDNGIGIKKEALSKIMQRNYQVDSPSKSGIGLGLYMVETSLKTLGGSIEINSEYGLGSEFIVTIPNRIDMLPSSN